MPCYLSANETYENYVVKNIEARDQRVVIKTPSNELKVLKVGDLFGDTKALVSEIFVDKIVLTEQVMRKNGQKVKQRVLIYQEKNGQSLVERMSLFPEETNRNVPLVKTQKSYKIPTKAKSKQQNK